MSPRGLQAGQGTVIETFGIWPRRKPTIVVKVEGRFHRMAAPTYESLELTIPNPAFKEYPHWISQTLPATNRVGQTDFVLERVNFLNKPAHFPFGMAELEYRVLENGRLRVIGRWPAAGSQMPPETKACLGCSSRPRGPRKDADGLTLDWSPAQRGLREGVPGLCQKLPTYSPPEIFRLALQEVPSQT